MTSWGALLLVSWIFVLGPVYRSSGSFGLAQTTSLAYPVLDVVVMTLLLYVQLGSRRALWDVSALGHG